MPRFNVFLVGDVAGPRTSHTYDEDLAKAVFWRLPNYLPLLDALLNKLKL